MIINEETKEITEKLIHEVKYLKSIVKVSKWILPRLKNKCFRPSLILRISQNKVTFINDKKHHIGYLCLMIRNPSKRNLSINLNQVKINGEPYLTLFQKDENISLYANGYWKDCENEVIKIYKEKRTEIHQDTSLFEIKAYETKPFPLPCKQENHYALIKNYQDSFFSSKKYISIILEVNGIKYEYEIDKILGFSNCINHLAFNQDEKK